jgi:hypothetical protein
MSLSSIDINKLNTLQDELRILKSSNSKSKLDKKVTSTVIHWLENRITSLEKQK